MAKNAIEKIFAAFFLETANDVETLEFHQ